MYVYMLLKEQLILKHWDFNSTLSDAFSEVTSSTLKSVCLVDFSSSQWYLPFPIIPGPYKCKWTVIVIVRRKKCFQATIKGGYRQNNVTLRHAEEFKSWEKPPKRTTLLQLKLHPQQVHKGCTALWRWSNTHRENVPALLMPASPPSLCQCQTQGFKEVQIQI